MGPKTDEDQITSAPAQDVRATGNIVYPGAMDRMGAPMMGGQYSMDGRAMHPGATYPVGAGYRDQIYNGSGPHGLSGQSYYPQNAHVVQGGAPIQGGLGQHYPGPQSMSYPAQLTGGPPTGHSLAMGYGDNQHGGSQISSVVQQHIHRFREQNGPSNLTFNVGQSQAMHTGLHNGQYSYPPNHPQNPQSFIGTRYNQSHPGASYAGSTGMHYAPQTGLIGAQGYPVQHSGYPGQPGMPGYGMHPGSMIRQPVAQPAAQKADPAPAQQQNDDGGI